MTTLKNFFFTFLDKIVLHSIRNSFLMGGMVLLLSNTGTWQFLSNSMLAHDFKRAAFWSQPNTSAAKVVVVVAIDDAGYQGFFDAKSPLNRERVKQLLETVSNHAPKALRITLDIDLSPMPGQAAEQQILDDFLLRKPQQWVLPAINSGADSDVAKQIAWRAKLCQKGVSFGVPHIPSEFGYPKLTHQNQNGLADMSLQTAGQCAEPTTALKQKVMPLSHTMLQAGLVLPFSGDLEALGDMLDAVEPDWIVVGGAWGTSDIFATPFGDRYGLMIHAAALAGAFESQRIAPLLLQVGLAGMFVALMSALLSFMTGSLKRWTHPASKQMSGHTFFEVSVFPMLFTLAVIALLLLFFEVFGFLHDRTGYWIPSSVVGCTVLAEMLMHWNWGKDAPHEHIDLKTAWDKIVALPIKKDISSIATAAKVLYRGAQPQDWELGPTGAPISRRRAAFEFIFALVSLLLQTLLPLASVVYAAVKTI